MKYTSTPSIAQSNSLVSHYGAYIDKIDWTFYCTFSTRYPLTLKLARTYMERLHIFLEVNLKLCNNIFWVAEPFDSKYGYHIHTVVKLNCDYPHNNAEILNKAWQIVTKGSNGKMYNRTSIEPYKPNMGGNFYLTKYIGRRDIDYDFF